jgi:hypothetical protein
MAEEKITQHSIVQTEINNGWIVTRLKEIKKSALELEAEGKPGEAYQREYYEARLLPLEQQCEVMDKVELEILALRRKGAAYKQSVTEGIKALNGKVSKTRVKALETDRDTRFITTPGDAAVKKARRDSGYATRETKAKVLGPRRIEELQGMMAATGMSPEDLGQLLAKKGTLTQLDAEYLKSLEAAK